MQLAGDVADLLGEARLDVHVDVFELRTQDEFAALVLVEDLVEAAFDLLRFAGGDDVLAAEHAGVGDRRLDILGQEHGVGVDGGRVGFDHLVRPLEEPSTPGLRRGLRGGFYGGAAAVVARTGVASRRTYTFSHFPSRTCTVRRSYSRGSRSLPSMSATAGMIEAFSVA